MDVRTLLDRFRRMPREGPIELSEAYLRRVVRQENSPANAPGQDKSWVDRLDREFREHYRRAVRVR